MSIIGWSVVILALVVLLALVCRRSPGAVGYTRGHGYCPNMGAYTGCNVCEED